MLKAKTRQELLQGYDYVDKISLVQSMSDSHIRVLRDDIDEWKLIVPKLGLEAKEVELIDQQEQRDTMKRHAALHKWKRKLGKRATYLCFLNACMQVNDIALAERMLDLLNEHMKGKNNDLKHRKMIPITSPPLPYPTPLSPTSQENMIPLESE